MTRGTAAPRVGFTTFELIRVVLVGGFIVWIVTLLAVFVDQRLRTETVEPFFANGPIPLAPTGEILVARRDLTAALWVGSIDAYDPATRETRSVVTALRAPVAADASPDGTICAIVGGLSQPARASSVRCTSGLAVDVGGPTEGAGD